MQEDLEPQIIPGADPARQVRGAMSVIFGSQVS